MSELNQPNNNRINSTKFSFFCLLPYDGGMTCVSIDYYYANFHQTKNLCIAFKVSFVFSILAVGALAALLPATKELQAQHTQKRSTICIRKVLE